MKRISLLLISMLLMSGISAQNRLDLLTLSGRFTTPQAYTDENYTGDAQETGGSLGLNIPAPLSKKSIIYTNFNYFYFHVSNDAAFPDSVLDPTILHAFILRTGLVQKLGNGQSLQLLLAPRFMTDMEGGGMDNFQMGGVAMYQKVFSERLTMGFGATYNQEFFGPYLVPIINLDWKIGDKFAIAGMLPIYAKIKYLASEKLTVGISHFGLSTTFGLNKPEYENDYLERQSIDLALFAQYNIYQNFFIEARIGQSMSRSYRQYSSDEVVDFAIPLATFGDERIPNNVQFEDGMFCELRLVYSIPIPED